VLDAYFRYFQTVMTAEAATVRTFYMQHHGKLGEAHELVLQRFFASCLPKKFSIGSGFALFPDASFSTEQDIVIYDGLNNPVFFPEFRSAIFPPSAVHALVEVKANLRLEDLGSTVTKTAAVKQKIRTTPHEVLDQQSWLEPMVCLFAFGGPQITTVKRNLISLQEKVEARDRLDFVCILNKGLITGGTYFEISTFGEPTSRYAQNMPLTERAQLRAMYPDNVKCMLLKDDSLFVFYYWLVSYLIRRPVVVPDLMSLVREDRIWGREC